MWHSVRKFLLIFLITAIIAACVACALFVGAVFGLWGNTEDIDIEALTLQSNTDIVYLDPDTGEEKHLLTLSAEENRVWVDLDATPKNMQNALVAIEDERFYTHNGVDLPRTIRATLTYLANKITGKSGAATLGGSTITQQLIKNITGEDDQTPARKIVEISRAISLEKQLSKEQILELYMNCIYLSQGCNGVQTAANLYFEKDISALNLAECASIAGITQNPGLYDPFVNPDKNKERQELVLAKMLELNYITQAEYDEAIHYELQFADPSRQKLENESITSYYVDQVVRDVLRDLQAKGYSESLANKMLYSGGLKITAAYDPEIQQIVEDYYKDADNFADSEAQSAIVVMDPSTGQVVGIAGGIGEKTGRFTLNRATQSPRQPGSAIKPLSVYAPALDQGIINTGSTFEDERKSYDGWTPRNYDYRYRGLVSLNYAIQQSLNTVPVEILSKMGVRTSFDFLTQKLGITTLVEGENINGDVYTDLGYSQLALGGLTHGTTVLEIAAAYCTFANNGVYNKPYTYTKVEDSDGNEILVSRNAESSWEAMKPSTAYLMTQLLTEVVTSGTGRGAGLSGGIQTAGKTGTTTDENDRWFVGYTANYVAAVWYGYDTPKPITASGNPCIPPFRSIMNDIHDTLDEYKEFSRPTGLVYASYCSESGLKPTSSCPVAHGYFTEGATPSTYCNLRHTAPSVSSGSSQSSSSSSESSDSNETGGLTSSGSESEGNSESGEGNGSDNSQSTQQSGTAQEQQSTSSEQSGDGQGGQSGSQQTNGGQTTTGGSQSQTADTETGAGIED